MPKELKKKFDSLVKSTTKYLNDSGVTEKVNQVSEVAEDQFDTISGFKQFKLVEEQLELQGKYNDILAQKLEEALDRIAMIESKFSKAA